MDKDAIAGDIAVEREAQTTGRAGRTGDGEVQPAQPETRAQLNAIDRDAIARKVYIELMREERCDLTEGVPGMQRALEAAGVFDACEKAAKHDAAEERCPECKCRKSADIHAPGYSCDYYTRKKPEPSALVQEAREWQERICETEGTDALFLYQAQDLVPKLADALEKSEVRNEAMLLNAAHLTEACRIACESRDDYKREFREAEAERDAMVERAKDAIAATHGTDGRAGALRTAFRAILGPFAQAEPPQTNPGDEPECGPRSATDEPGRPSSLEPSREGDTPPATEARVLGGPVNIPGDLRPGHAERRVDDQSLKSEPPQAEES